MPANAAHPIEGLKNRFFPIYKAERKKFLLLSLLFFLMSFNYVALGSLKEMWLLSHTDAVTIYYLRVLGVPPSIFLFTLGYSQLHRKWGRDGRFYGLVGYFLLFFCLASYILLPHLSHWQLDALADTCLAAFPTFKGLWEMMRYWPLALFYIHADAWGTLILGVLFWTLVHEVTSFEQSKRFYSFLSLGAAVGLMIGGIVVKYIQDQYITPICLMVILAMLWLYHRLTIDMKANPAQYRPAKGVRTTQGPLAWGASLRLLFRSRYVAAIATLVIAYGLGTTLLEAAWKAQVKQLQLQEGTDALALIYGNQGIYTGLLTAVFILFISKRIAYQKWGTIASMPPIILLMATSLLFTAIYYKQALASWAHVWNVDAQWAIVGLGLVQIIVLRAVKFTLFDPTKERTYLPLDPSIRVPSKAAIDGVASRLGKSIGSLLVTFILVPLLGDGSIESVQPYLFLLLLATIGFWLRAVHTLTNELNKLERTQEQSG